DWGARLGYTPAMLAEVNRQAIALLEAVRSEYEPASAPVVISGCIGPRGDGYTADTTMNPNQAKAYHAIQVETFADT
ncbi:MAG: homocysteine S-methyltransferase, partial [Gemmatimonadales bacterium]|nr:homocysteine S-methyltransferase [Gemmatimonadales bacterium]